MRSVAWRPSVKMEGGARMDAVWIYVASAVIACIAIVIMGLHSHG